jgi:hypothetical protein
VEGRVPGVELEAGFAAETLASRLQLGPREGGDGLAGDGAREGVPEVALAAALAVAKAAVQEPGGVDQEGLRERQSRFKFGRGCVDIPSRRSGERRSLSEG